MSRDIHRPEEVTDEAAQGVRDRRLHGGAPRHLDDDALVERVEEERVEAGVADFDPDDVPAATDVEPEGDVTDSDAYRDELAEVRRQESDGELGQPGDYPPSSYPRS
jgi:hypothetical protein